MFAMFCFGLVLGAAWAVTTLAFCSTKPDLYKIAMFILLTVCLMSQWIIADRDNQALAKYQQVSGGKGDGL